MLLVNSELEGAEKKMAVASFETEFRNLIEQNDEKHAKSQATWSGFEQNRS